MASTDDTWMIEVDGVLVPDYDRTLTDFSEGDVVTGTVVRVDKDEILVDIGYKSEGRHPGRRAQHPPVGEPRRGGHGR